MGDQNEETKRKVAKATQPQAKKGEKQVKKQAEDKCAGQTRNRQTGECE